MSVLKKRAQDMQKRIPQDIDPEDDPSRYRDDDDSSDEDKTHSGGREHYETVQKSKLRKSEQPKLDKKYGGVAVSRDDLESVEEDPFAPVEDDEDEDPFGTKGEAQTESEPSDSQEQGEDQIDSEVSSEDEDHQALQSTKILGVNGVRDGNSSEDMSNTDDDDDSHDSEGLMDDGDESEDSDSSMEGVEEEPSGASDQRKQMKKIVMGKAAELTVVSSLSASATDQTRKGAAVQQQQDTFDRLLNSRIKLQKALTSANELNSDDQIDDDVTVAASKAEAAAMSLWSTIDAIRCDILAHNQSAEPRTKKRKIEALEPSSHTPLSTLHAHSQGLESAVLPVRQGTLNHWYSRTRPAVAPTTRSALSIQPDDTTISSVLTTYLSTNLSKLAANAQSSLDTYDDTAFYQSLLTALIASRTNAALVPSALPSSALPATRNPKIKKNVDTKASKGRKIRYTVHDKLQNFMAPEDRTTWTEEGRREFFGSLLGQVLADGEDRVEDEADEGDGMDGAGALRLFGGVAV